MQQMFVTLSQKDQVEIVIEIPFKDAI